MEKMVAGKVKTITSLTNPIIKDLRALTLKKNREREGVFIAEGLKLVLEGLELGYKIRTLVYAEKDGSSELVEKAAARAYSAGALIIKANNKIMEAITHRENAQNVVAVFEQQWQTLEQLLNSRRQNTNLADRKPAGRLFVALDRVRDPGNLGTIIRTSDAVGADGIILVGDTVSPYALEAVRATMGSIFALPLSRVTEQQFIDYMATFKGQLVGTHLKGSVDYRTISYFDKDRDTVLLMGNEQKGLTDELANTCSALARIPQVGRADSLNLAVSTGVMLYEICRKRLAI